MTVTRVHARKLRVGDVIRVVDQPGWWQVTATFAEASDVIDIDLVAVDGAVESPCNWHLSADQSVERRP